MLGFIDYGYMQYAFVADRFQYLAGIGVMSVVIGAVTYSVRRLSDLWQKGARVVAAMVIVVLGIQTWNQVGIWRDNETLNRHIIALNPQARDAHLNLGVGLDEQGRYAEAVAAYRVAVEQRPDKAEAHSYLGESLRELGRFEEAEKHLRRALTLNPSHTKTLYSLATLRFDQQRYDEMLELLQRLIDIDPSHAKAHVSMGAALFYLGRGDEALQRFEQALALDPTMEEARINRKAVLKAMEAIQE